MTLPAGTRLGPYEILAKIGEGGMGEVYRARDARLDRFVAVKVLPSEWASDVAMQERFDREAKAIASLNHPHICALHDVGRENDISYLVMELLEGETLAARIARGALSLDEALDVAVPIADALDQAHRRGVIHRDLKPGNIMLTRAAPKLLDFGLARTPVRPARKSSGSGESGTVAAVPTTPLTVPGLLIGTLQYMAPEQLDGLEADARTDIFAFGAILHEMITGKRAFGGKSQILLISSIATSEPPPLSIEQPATPPALEHVVKICLAKNPDDRWQTARDLLAELKWIASGGAAATAVMPVTGSPRRRIGRLLPALAALTVAVAAALAVPAFSYFKGPPARPELRFRLWPRPYIAPATPEGWFDISRDGRGFVFRGDQQQVPDEPGLYVGRIGELTYRRLFGTDRAAQPFWSADGTSVGFLQDQRLMRVRLDGDPPQEIARFEILFGADWNEAGAILLGSPAGIQRVSAEGGTPELIVPKADGHAGSYWPHFLPGGRRFLYLAWAANPRDRAIMAASLDDPTPVKVMNAESNAAVTTAGFLIFHRGDAMFAQAFDAGALRPSGETTRLAAGIESVGSNGFGAFAAAQDGTLVYFQTDQALNTGGFHEQRVWQPQWVDRTGQQVTPVGSIQRHRGAEVSPDGRRIAFHRHEDAGGDIWILEPSGTERRLTFDPSRDNSSPIWSPPDGQFIVFGARKDGKWGLYRRLSDGRGGEEKLFDSEQVVTPMSWSPDGRRIVFALGSGEANSDLWVLTLESAGGAVSTSDKPQAFASTPGNETHAQISRDGRWLAYASDETRRSTYEVYVRPFPAGPGVWQVSQTGGKWPRWSKDGRELLFLLNVPDNQTGVPGQMHRVAFSGKGDAFVHEPEVDFFRLRALNLKHPGGDFSTYAVGDNGKILVFSLAPPPATASASVPPDWESGLTVLRFWESAIRKR